MPIDPSNVVWDTPDPANVVWDDDKTSSSQPPLANDYRTVTGIIDRQFPVFGAAAGAGRMALTGTLGTVGKAIGRLTDLATGTPNNRAESFGQSASALVPPAGPTGQAMESGAGEGAQALSSALDRTPFLDPLHPERGIQHPVNTPLGQTLKEAIPEAAGDVGMVMGAGSALRRPPEVVPPPHPLAGAAEAETTRLGGVKSRMEANGLSLSPGKGEVNQPIADAITRQDLGLPKDAPMTHDAEGNVPIMDAARGLYAGPAYNEARALPSVKLSPVQQKLLGKVNPNFIPEEMRPNADGTISGASAVDLSKLLRKSGSKMANSNQILNDGTEVSEMGSDRLKAANALEDAVHDYYVENGQQDKADALYNARVYTAKSYSAEAALDGAGHVRVGALKQQTLRGKPLSGGIADLSQMGLQYPDAFKAIPAKAAPGIIKKTAAAIAPLAGAAVGSTVIPGPLGPILGTATGEYAAGKILK